MSEITSCIFTRHENVDDVTYSDIVKPLVFSGAARGPDKLSHNHTDLILRVLTYITLVIDIFFKCVLNNYNVTSNVAVH